MTDNENGGTAMGLSAKSSVDEDDQSINKKGADIDLRRMRRHQHIQLYKKLLSLQAPVAEGLPVEILRVLTSSDEIGDERVLLGSLTLATNLCVGDSSEELTNLLKNCWNLRTPVLNAFQENFQICDLEWFKLAMTHGYLQLNVENIHSPDLVFLAFKVLRKNCLTYTKYSYIAYKILQTWMEKTSEMKFWLEYDTNEIETKLEAIIFSNWDNCINEISRRNACQIFPIYLKIMSNKYNGFLEYVFENCIQNFSWQNVTKYTILVEVCKISCNLTSIVNSGLIACIFTSLTKNHLKQAGTLLYSTILRKMKANEWEIIFAEDFFRISAEWETEKELAAIDLLWQQWMKPTIQKFPSIFEYLWKHDSMKKLQLSQMYLARMGDQRAFQAIYNDENFSKMLGSRIVDISETTRLNAFAIIARNNDWTGPEPFGVVKRFLYFNVNASTIIMRKGIVEKFQIFFAKIIKLANGSELLDDAICEFINWLHRFLLDCFEIGSSYQRKILGLKLYSVIMNFTIDSSVNGVSTKGTKYVATLKSANALRRRMIEKGNWTFDDRQSAFLLMRLVFDPADDVRDTAASILIRYFEPHIFVKSDKKVLAETSLRLCQSSRVQDIAGGSAVLKILEVWKYDIEWMDGTSKYVDWFVNSAISQLDHVKGDILKSATEGSSFFGALTVILEIGLTEDVTNDVTRTLLDLIEEATNFFLSAFSLDDKNNEFSSSFEDMSIAVDSAIKNSEMDGANEVDDECSLSPAHQIVVSCIWMSLKVSCDLASEIGCRAENKEIVERAANLIVSVLLKCRHKGAIEAAGLALAKLTKVACTKNYDGVIQKHLENLLSIDDKNNINLTRRGAGMTIMFHRIVSSDTRYNRPFVHLAAATLLNNLKEKHFQHNEHCQSDSTCARHLHFLRSLIADKGLQAHLVQYMEQVCLLCFEYLQAPEWTVRNASLQLFGAIVPRLVGQCSPKELDYGIGNSINHFVTHYPKLATSIFDELETSTRSFGSVKNDFPTVSKIVPLLTLLSKMGTSGCDLVDYSCEDYIIRGKKIFLVLLAHPVFHVRNLAAKAYAAFVPLVDTLYELTVMKMRKINWHSDNYNHGQLLAQFYLRRKYEYETKCTSNKFVIRKHNICEKQFDIAIRVQLARAEYFWKKEAYTLFGPPREQYTVHNLCSFPISSMLLNCLIGCPVALSILKNRESTANCETYDHQFISSLFDKKTGTPPMLGLSEFLKNVIAFKSQFLSCSYTRQFYMNHARTAKHHAIVAANLEDLTPDYLLKSLVADALEMVNDSSITYTLLYELSSILDILQNRRVSKEVEKNLTVLSESLKNIDENSGRSCADKLRNIGHTIAIYTDILSEELFRSTIYYLSKVMEHASANVETKFLVIDCLSHLVGKLFSHDENAFVFNLKNPEVGKFLCIITTLLVDGDAETRDFAASKLSPMTNKIVGRSDEYFCSRASIFIILTKLTFVWAQNTIILPSDCFEIFKSIINSMSTKESVRALKSPYEQDDTFQRDDTELLNILTHCVRLFNKKQEMPIKYDDLQNINGVISAKQDLRDFGDQIEYFTNLSTPYYLMLKKQDLMDLIKD
ncbi:uncharacterized protein [Venturia canescens]|uniref:uncharacterized protein n=1 Tax=Venturia canescens TaxID=32260 RepID=UPI001C9C8DD2|nr:uncharacterized protein LOC122416371 [Venturia canescens]